MFFHIGLHKTATTWFQRHLFPNLPGVNCLVTRRIAASPEPAAKLLDRSSSRIKSLSGTLSSEKQPGDNKKRLTETLCLDRRGGAQCPIIIGFREHRSWLTAALRCRRPRSRA